MKKTIRDIDVKGKHAVVRCDFNVPMQDGVITDDNRIVSALPTIRYLIENGYSTRIRVGSYRIPVGSTYEEIAKIITGKS